MLAHLQKITPEEDSGYVRRLSILLHRVVNKNNYAGRILKPP